MSIKIIKLNYKTFVFILISLFLFFHFVSFIEGESGKTQINRSTFVFILLIFLLFISLLNKVRLQKNYLYLFFLFIYYPIIELLHFNIERGIMISLWIFYSFLIIPWALNGPLVFKNLKIFTITFCLAFLMLLFLGIFESINNLENNKLFFGSEERLRFTSNLGNPGIISKISVTLFFLSLLIWSLARKPLFAFFCILSTIVIYFAGMRTDIIALIFSMFFFIMSSKPKFFYLGLIFTIIILIISIFTLLSLDFNVLDSLLSSRITSMWIPAFTKTGFLNSINIYFGVGYTGTYFDNNYLYILISFGLVGFIILMLTYYIIYNEIRSKLFSKILTEKIVSRWRLSVLVFIMLGGLTQIIFPTFYNSYGLVLFPVLVGLKDINVDPFNKIKK